MSEKDNTSGGLLVIYVSTNTFHESCLFCHCLDNEFVLLTSLTWQIVLELGLSHSDKWDTVDVIRNRLCRTLRRNGTKEYTQPESEQEFLLVNQSFIQIDKPDVA